MKGNYYGNDSDYWGKYSQYESYVNDGNIASYYPGSYESTNQGQNSGQAAGGLWQNNEVMARQLQEMIIYGEESGNTTNSAWEGNPGGTSANRGGTSIRVSTNVQTRAGGEVDLDNMSYEEMYRFEESMGSVSKGLSKEAVSRLPVHKYSPSSTRSKSGDAECVVCKMEYERGDRLIHAHTSIMRIALRNGWEIRRIAVSAKRKWLSISSFWHLPW